MGGNPPATTRRVNDARPKNHERVTSRFSSPVNMGSRNPKTSANKARSPSPWKPEGHVHVPQQTSTTSCSARRRRQELQQRHNGLNVSLPIHREGRLDPLGTTRSLDCSIDSPTVCFLRRAVPMNGNSSAYLLVSQPPMRSALTNLEGRRALAQCPWTFATSTSRLSARFGGSGIAVRCAQLSVFPFMPTEPTFD